MLFEFHSLQDSVVARGPVCNTPKCAACLGCSTHLKEAFRIKDTAERGITREQLSKLVGFIYKMADRWCETVGEHRGTRLRFDTFNLYHANYWIIKPATEGYEKKGCSLVEIMAIQVQRPNWFVSHAWIEPWLMCGGRLCYCVYFKRNYFVWGWAQILVNGPGSRRGSYRNQTNPCTES